MLRDGRELPDPGRDHQHRTPLDGIGDLVSPFPSGRLAVRWARYDHGGQLDPGFILEYPASVEVTSRQVVVGASETEEAADQLS